MKKILLPLACAAIFFAACDGLKEEKNGDEGRPAVSKKAVPEMLPGDTLYLPISKSTLPDSIRQALKQGMKDVLSSYDRRYKDKYYTGYFVTDLNGDSLPELWVKSGTHRENSRLELYYPLRDGTLKKSSTPAEPGDYYLGEGYVIQIVGAGAGMKNVNRITLRRGEMDIENIQEIDYLDDAKSALPKPEEPKIKVSALGSKAALDKAF